MDRDFLRSFRRWLREASLDELRGRHLTVIAEIHRITSPEVKADARRLLKALEQEITERLLLDRR